MNTFLGEESSVENALYHDACSMMRVRVFCVVVVEGFEWREIGHESVSVCFFCVFCELWMNNCVKWTCFE